MTNSADNTNTIAENPGEENLRLKTPNVVGFPEENPVFFYDDSAIDIEQAVLANQILDFQNQQLQNPPKNFDAFVQSGGVEWFCKCAAALLRSKDPSSLYKPFTPVSWRNAEMFVRALPYREMHRIGECLDDFFTNMGKQDKYLRASKNAFNSRGSEITSTLTKMVAERFLQSDSLNKSSD